ncbi:MAG TPA: dTDP-4-dehydrorhamnose reductase, partial [Thermoanaerobaculia bacterium]|nr:dTDP-4-dehydrorhamnose reductase [Thermoanaerobaculia bacterium]
MKWLITGAGGMLGTDVRDELAARGEDVIALTRNDLDVTDSRAVDAVIREHAPAFIINCAAYTKVDQAESEERAANAINGSAVELLAHAANATNAVLVHVSTYVVFDGSSTTPYEPDAPTAPLSAYGRSKLLGEIAAAHAKQHLIVRTAWLFGVHGPNFVEAIRNQIRKGTNPLRVVHDQRGRPTYTPHLARALVRLAPIGRGVVHYADRSECSWFDFARAIAEESGANADLQPVTTDEFPRPARRPADSVL